MSSPWLRVVQDELASDGVVVTEKSGLYYCESPEFDKPFYMDIGDINPTILRRMARVYLERARRTYVPGPLGHEYVANDEPPRPINRPYPDVPTRNAGVYDQRAIGECQCRRAETVGTDRRGCEDVAVVHTNNLTAIPCE